MTTTIGSLFSGIGGLELGLERAGLGPVLWQAEIDPFCRSILRRHWPAAKVYRDVREVDERAASVDVICGGFPCQPASIAGRRRAQSDERWLWPDFARVIEAVRPRWVVIENVPGLRSAGMRDVLRDLSRLGLDACWSTLSAADAGAPHLRMRLFIVASDPLRVDVRNGTERIAARLADRVRATWEGVARNAVEAIALTSDADSLRRLESSRRFAEIRGWPKRVGWDFDPVARMVNGVPARMDLSGGDSHADRSSALGNAVVVQCAEEVGLAIAEVEAELGASEVAR